VTPWLRYVILRHDAIAEPHFDLMFESSPGSLLTTWRCDHWPIDRPTKLTRLPDHRQDYLEYEGPISGDRGNVRRVEAGVYRAHPQRDDPHAADWWLNDPPTAHLSLLSPPGHDWSIEPAT
jgi:hypothetical protein